MRSPDETKYDEYDRFLMAMWEWEGNNAQRQHAHSRRVEPRAFKTTAEELPKMAERQTDAMTTARKRL